MEPDMNRLSMMMAAITVGAMALPVVAQDEPKVPPSRTAPTAPQTAPGERERSLTARMQLSPEQLQRAWELQAKGTAARLGLDEAGTGKLVEAYSTSRKALQAESDKQRQLLREKMQAARDSGGEMPDRRSLAADMQKAIDDFAATERTKLQTAFGTFLDAKQTEGAMQSLGAMAPMAFTQWDGMVTSIADMGLESTKNVQAMAALENYVIKASQVRGQEGEAARSLMNSARSELETAIKPLLSEDQFTQFSRTMGGPRDRMRGDGAPRGGDPRRGEPGQRGAPGTGTPGGSGSPGTGAGGGAGGRGGQGSGQGESPR
jgi:hypothetical protein